MNYMLQFDIAAILIVGLLMLLYFSRRNFPNIQNSIFIGMMVNCLLASLCDMLSAIAIDQASRMPTILCYIPTILYMLAYLVSNMLYVSYVISLSRNDIKDIEDKLVKWGIIIISAVCFLLVLTTGFTHLVVYFGKDNSYHWGVLFVPMYLLSMVVPGLALRDYHKRKKYIQSINQKMCIIAYCVITLVGMLIQIIWPEVLIMNFLLSVYLVVLYTYLQNPEHYMDKDLQVFNQKALIELLNGYFRNKKKFTVVAFELDGYDYVTHVLGLENGNHIIKQISDFLVWNFPHKDIFHLQGAEFVFLLPYQDPDVKRIARDVRHEFRHPVMINEIEVIMTPQICSLSYPDMAQSVDDVIDAIRYSYEEARQSGTGEIVYASEKSLLKKRREADIMHAIKHAIHNDEFQVYYQPIYSTKTGNFETAEALVRLIDSKLGFISPEEFIPMAEKDGTILEIGAAIFEKVCRFLSDNQANEMGIHYIEVNLSVVQCMQESLASQLLEIMDKYNIPSDRINLEITETANFDSDEVLRHNMNTLIERGLTFSMDDYGTGFSTASYLIDLPFKLIKIDKSILWSAMEDERALVVLKHTVEMIKELSLQIVVEGVENQDMVDILTAMGCDYLQGYKFSKPVPEENYIAFLKDNLQKKQKEEELHTTDADKKESKKKKKDKKNQNVKVGHA